MNTDNTKSNPLQAALTDPVRMQTLLNGLGHTCGDRDIEYGSPVENMQMIADLWSAYLGFKVTAEQVALCMVLVKIARTTSGQVHEDTYEDGCAYMAIGCECAVYAREQVA